MITRRQEAGVLPRTGLRVTAGGRVDRGQECAGSDGKNSHQDESAMDAVRDDQEASSGLPLVVGVASTTQREVVMS